MITDPPPPSDDPNPDIDNEPGDLGPEQARCPVCTLGHSIQRCPEIRALLFGISIELRARAKGKAAERVEFAPF